MYMYIDICMHVCICIFITPQLPSGPLVGFDSFFGYLHWGMDYFTHEFPPKVHTGPVVCRGFDLVNSTRATEEGESAAVHVVNSPGGKHRGVYADELFYREAVRKLTAHNQSQPLYLCVAFQGLHDPYQAPKDEELGEARCGGARDGEDGGDETAKQQGNSDGFDDPVSLAKCGNYSKMLTKVDSLVGNLVQKMKTLGMWHSTVLLLHTDNGGALAWFVLSLASLRSFSLVAIRVLLFFFFRF
uniref:Sulfatase N-terminal domain-containing protein n=1 Tax=Lotharella globosa TaxID=91324 RepID=A0A7S3YZA1_9EUKA